MEKTVESEQKKIEDSEMIDKTTMEEIEIEKKSSLSKDQKFDLLQEVRKYSDTFFSIRIISLLRTNAYRSNMISI
jgi:hypothetical protein